MIIKNTKDVPIVKVEMDGVKDKQENVIIIGATNAAESILDPALLRSGRFDRKVYIDIHN